MSERHARWNLYILAGPIVLGLLASLIGLGVSKQVHRDRYAALAERHSCKEDSDCILWASACCTWEAINKKFDAPPAPGSACAMVCENDYGPVSCTNGRCESKETPARLRGVTLEIEQRVQEGTPGSQKGVTIVRDELVREFQGKVVGITDGDTVRILKEGKEMKIRLWGIDAPERKQPFGTKSKQYLSSLILGQAITVEHKGTDKSGRTLGVITTSDGKNVNLEMVRAGMAWWYGHFAPGAVNFKAAQEEAESAKRGLWVDKGQTPPWQWKER